MTPLVACVVLVAAVTHASWNALAQVLRRGGDAVLAAELSVNWAYRVWRGLPVEGRGVGPALLDADALARTGPGLDAAAARWAAVPDGGELLWRWGTDR
ncbi:hypothetical protein [Streptomyces sp. NPDC093105]|uniref:hypothetical protein n=1 Tax=Streptomyces sp. NPDC093105 TaxID=3366029 RepID=UPI00381ADA8B